MNLELLSNAEQGYQYVETDLLIISYPSVNAEVVHNWSLCEAYDATTGEAIKDRAFRKL